MSSEISVDLLLSGKIYDGMERISSIVTKEADISRFLATTAPEATYESMMIAPD